MAEETKKEEPKVEEVKATEKPASVPAATNESADRMAIAALILGIFNLCTWFIPFCGLPFSLLGIGLGVAGMKSEKNKTLAIIGIVLSGIGFVLSLCNAFFGAMLALS